MKIQLETKLNSSAENAWKIFGEGFGQIAEWSSNLSQSSIDREPDIGATRTCKTAKSFGPFKPGVVREVLTEFDPVQKTFAYRAISGLPGFIAEAGNRWSIHKVDDENCIVRFDGEIKTRGLIRWFGPLVNPLMRIMIKSDLKQFTEEMQYRVEHGKPHPRKQS